MSGTTITARLAVMEKVLGELIDAGIPAQRTRRPTIAETPVDRFEVRDALRHRNVGGRFLLLDGTSLGIGLGSPVEAARDLGPCRTCRALRGDPCRTTSYRTRKPHKDRPIASGGAP